MDELRAVLKRPGGGAPLSDEEIAKIIGQWDTNDDGVLQYEEFEKMWTSTAPSKVARRDDGDDSAKKTTVGVEAAKPKEAVAPVAQQRPPTSFKKQGSGFFKEKAKRIGNSFRRTKERRPDKGAAASVLGGVAASDAAAKDTTEGAPRAKGFTASFRKKKANGGAAQSMRAAAATNVPPTPKAPPVPLKQQHRVTAVTRLAGTDLDNDCNASPTGKRNGKPLLKAAELAAMKAEYLRKGAEEETRRCSFASLPARLGEVLGRRKVDDVIRAWDANGDGVVSLMEFRRSLRDPRLGLDALDTSEIDALFRSFDTDGGGSVDANEMRVALTRLRKEATGAAKREADAEKKAEHWRMRARQVAEAVRAAADLEESEQLLLRTRVMLGKEEGGDPQEAVSGAVDARLYASMVRRNLKVGDVLSKWDVDRDGCISRDEFCREVKKLVPRAVEGEIDELFDTLDVCTATLPLPPTLFPAPMPARCDGSSATKAPTRIDAFWNRLSPGTMAWQEDSGGSLDIEEVKASLKKLQAAAERAADDEAKIIKQVTTLRKAARKVQEQVVAAKGEDEAAFALQAGKEKAAAEAKAVAAAEAQAAKAAVRAERAARAAAEKADFEARVREKQGAGKVQIMPTKLLTA